VAVAEKDPPLGAARQALRRRSAVDEARLAGSFRSRIVRHLVNPLDVSDIQSGHFWGLVVGGVIAGGGQVRNNGLLR
jgi:hypothetical protein